MNGLGPLPSLRRPLAWTLLAALPVCAAPETAAAQESRWTVRGTLARVAPTGADLTATLPSGEPFRFAVDDGLGLGAEIELRLGFRWGVELAALVADLDADFAIPSGAGSLADTESASFELYGAGVNAHLTPGRRADLHLGLFAAMIALDDTVFLAEAGRADKLVFDDDVGLGLKLGLDRPVGARDRWLISVGIRYLAAILEGEVAGQDGDLDPLILSVGLGRRF